MEQATAVKNEKPRSLGGTKIQGVGVTNGNGKSTTSRDLKESKTRYERGLELYRAAAVSINPSGHGFRVNGYTVDPEKITCECPDYQKNKIPCKHFYAASLFQKNGCKVRKASNSALEARSKDFISPREKYVFQPFRLL